MMIKKCIVLTVLTKNFSLSQAPRNVIMYADHDALVLITDASNNLKG